MGTPLLPPRRHRAREPVQRTIHQSSPLALALAPQLLLLLLILLLLLLVLMLVLLLRARSCGYPRA
jgi:hypothetical protein